MAAAGTSQRARALRTWLLPLSILSSAALAVFVLTFYVDASADPDPRHVFGLLLHPNPASAANTLSNAGEVVAAVLAIAITVVAIIVELASNRYTHRITELFIAEPTNFLVMGFFVLTALQSLFVTLVFDWRDGHGGFVPYLGIATSMGMLTVCLLILLPYFAFVFSFLNPISIVSRIRQHTLDVIKGTPGRTQVDRVKQEAVRGIEQLSDVAMNAMEHNDKGVSMASVDALRTLVVDYQRMRSLLPEPWYRVDTELARNPDFVSMSTEVLDEVLARRIWLEMKVLRQYQMLYNEALNNMRDINYSVSHNTRLMAGAALACGNTELFDLCVKFFNTYLRATINARDVRTAYNVLNQYRLLAESVLLLEGGARAVEIARYFKYYGLLSFNAKLPFILETVAYDLCALNEIAFDQKSLASRELLRIFLQVDKESEGEVQETSLRGVRKAQVKLATYYLVRGDETLAREVHKDMSTERPERLASIRDELLNVSTREFWEISDRGVNFDYLPPDRKAKMLFFFEWFGDLLPPRASVLLTVSGEMQAVRSPEGAHSQATARGSGDPPQPSLHPAPGSGREP